MIQVNEAMLKREGKEPKSTHEPTATELDTTKYNSETDQRQL